MRLRERLSFCGRKEERNLSPLSCVSMLIIISYSSIISSWLVQSAGFFYLAWWIALSVLVSSRWVEINSDIILVVGWMVSVAQEEKERSEKK